LIVPEKYRNSKPFWTAFPQVEKEYFSIGEKQNIITYFSYPLRWKIVT